MLKLHKLYRLLYAYVVYFTPLDSLRHLLTSVFYGIETIKRQPGSDEDLVEVRRFSQGFYGITLKKGGTCYEDL